jgi:hypothetical protein
MSIIISNEKDPITLEPLEECRRKFAFLHKNVAIVYDFDNYKENIKKIGNIKPHTGERLGLVDKLSLNEVWTHYNEPIPFPELERKKEKKIDTEYIKLVILLFMVIVFLIAEIIFFIRCRGLMCIKFPF